MRSTLINTQAILVLFSWGMKVKKTLVQTLVFQLSKEDERVKKRDGSFFNSYLGQAKIAVG